MKKRDSSKILFIVGLVAILALFALYLEYDPKGPIGRAIQSLTPRLTDEPVIASVPSDATPRAGVTVEGWNLGSSGYLVLSGRRIQEDGIVFWTEDAVTFVVPEDGVSGPLYAVRGEDGQRSAGLLFNVNRPLGEYEPVGLQLGQRMDLDRGIGLGGSGTLIETDGGYLYVVTGWDTLVTYAIGEHTPARGFTPYDRLYNVTRRIYFPQRVTYLKLFNGYLFCVGDFGLRVYDCEDLQGRGGDAVVAVASDVGFYAVDVEEVGAPVDGGLIALCEYKKNSGYRTLTDPTLDVLLYKFHDESEPPEISLLGAYQYGDDIRDMSHLLGVAIDPVNRGIYLARQWVASMLGVPLPLMGGSIDVVDFSALDFTQPVTADVVTLETARIPWTMEFKAGLVWVGMGSPMVPMSHNVLRTYDPSNGWASEDIVVRNQGIAPIGFHGPRFKVLDANTVALSDGTFDNAHTFNVALMVDREDVITDSDWNTGFSADWAQDVTAYAETANRGRIFVADEWGGVVAMSYDKAGERMEGSFASGERPLDRFHIPTGGWGCSLHLAGDQVYVAAEGSGLWGVNRFKVSDSNYWKWVDWDWSEEAYDGQPQPHPTGALCSLTRGETTYLVARSHKKCFAWGSDIKGVLYRVAEDGIHEIATHVDENPDLLIRGIGVQIKDGEVIVPRNSPDLVYMTTALKGVHAFVVDTERERIRLHTSTPHDAVGLVEKDHEQSLAQAIGWCGRNGTHGQMVVAFRATPVLPFGSAGTGGLHRYDLEYAEGVPDSDHPDRPIAFVNKEVLDCLTGEDVYNLDITQSGIVAIATEHGIGIFDIDDFGAACSWGSGADSIKVNTSDWPVGPRLQRSAHFNDVSFDKNYPEVPYLYAVSNTRGLWVLDVPPEDPGNPRAVAYYPGSAGFNSNNDLEGDGLGGWGKPDLYTLHAPSSVEGIDGDVYVYGWAGKIYRLVCFGRGTVSGTAIGCTPQPVVEGE